MRAQKNEAQTQQELKPQGETLLDHSSVPVWGAGSRFQVHLPLLPLRPARLLWPQLSLPVVPHALLWSRGQVEPRAVPGRLLETVAGHTDMAELKDPVCSAQNFLTTGWPNQGRGTTHCHPRLNLSKAPCSSGITGYPVFILPFLACHSCPS